MTPLVVALTVVAGAVGALVRHLLHAAPARTARPRPWLAPPWRILAINVAASFVAGVAVATLPAAWEPVAVAGLCGGLSTWSTFMTDTHRFWREGHRMRALGLVAAHVGYGLLAAMAGLAAGRLLPA